MNYHKFPRRPLSTPRNARKILYIVLDGVADRPIPQINYQTTLQAASIPNINKLFHSGQAGQMYTVAKGITPQSHNAVISLLGYDPRIYSTGRGALEAFAVGLQVHSGNVALRCNFATKGKGKEIKDRRVARTLTTKEASVLCQAINTKVKLKSIPYSSFQFLNTVSQRAVLVLHNLKGLSAEITNVDPAYSRIGKLSVVKTAFEPIVQEVTPIKSTNPDPKAINAAKLTNEFVKKSGKILEEHPLNQERCKHGLLPANLILARDAGEGLPNFPSYQEMFELDFASFAEMPAEIGITRLMKMNNVKLPQPSDNLATDYQLRAQMVINHLPNHDGIYIHIKGPDEPAHDGDFQRKIEIIEQIDRHFFGLLLDKIDLRQTLIAITADHATPCILGRHSDDPVPLLISGSNIRPNGTRNFSEPDCANGSLGTLQSGMELLPRLIRLARE